MKRLRHRCFALAVFMPLILPVSCIRDRFYDLAPSPGAGVPVTISFRADWKTGGGATRGYADDNFPGELTPGTDDDVEAVGMPDDRAVWSLRVLVYDTKSGELICGDNGAGYDGPWNFSFEGPDNPAPAPPDPDNMEPGAWPPKLNILTGTYDFVFVANEEAGDGALRATLSDSASIDRLDKLSALRIGRTAYSSVAGSAVPMTSVVRGVEVRGDNTLRLPGSPTAITGNWSLPLVRTGIRLSFEIRLRQSQYERWDGKITVGNIPGWQGLLPGVDNSAAPRSSVQFDRIDCEGIVPGSYNDYGYRQNVIEALSPTEENTVVVRFDRIILPEVLLTGENDTKANSLVLKMNFDGAMQQCVLSPPGGGFGLPRNTWLWTGASISDVARFWLKTIEWGYLDLDEVDLSEGEWEFIVDRDRIVVPNAPGAESMRTVEIIRADHPDGWRVESKPEWVDVDADVYWNTGDPEPDRPWTVATLKISAGSENDGTDFRFGEITLKSGNLRKIIRVAQPPHVQNIAGIGEPPTGETCVGAFWNANEYGYKERIIRIPAGEYGGEWVAVVGWYEEGMWPKVDSWEDHKIVFADALSPTELLSSGIDWNAPSDPSWPDYLDSRKATEFIWGSVAAGGVIDFRIALTERFSISGLPEDKLVRSAVVLISYGGRTNPRTQKLFVRNGEYPVPIHDDGSDAGWTVANIIKAEDVEAYYMPASSEWYGGEWMGGEKPSMSGHLFRWGDPSWYPATGDAGVWPAANDPDPMTAENLPGYDLYSTRIELPAASQAHPSLTGDGVESVWGYYADGFFDRRQIVGGTTVRYYGSDYGYSPPLLFLFEDIAGYAGRLFYNADAGSAMYNRSVFFPAAGRRNVDTGELSGEGTEGWYWTRTDSDNEAAFLYFDRYGATQPASGSLLKGWGLSARGVKPESISMTPGGTASGNP